MKEPEASGPLRSPDLFVSLLDAIESESNRDEIPLQAEALASRLDAAGYGLDSRIEATALFAGLADGRPLAAEDVDVDRLRGFPRETLARALLAAATHAIAQARHRLLDPETFLFAKGAIALAEEVGGPLAPQQTRQLQDVIMKTPCAILIAPSSIRSDPTFNRTFVSRHGSYISMVDQRFRADEDFALAAVSSNRAAFDKLPDHLKQKRSMRKQMLMTAIRGDASGYRVLMGASFVEWMRRYGSDLRTDLDLIRAAVEEGRLFMLRMFDEETIRSTPDLKQTFDRYWKPLKELDIEFPERFDRPNGHKVGGAMLREIVRNRMMWESGQDDGRPPFVVLAPAVDYNGAYEMNNLAELMGRERNAGKRGHFVLYYEVENLVEWVDALRRATRGGTRPADGLEIEGHGWVHFMNLHAESGSLADTFGDLFSVAPGEIAFGLSAAAGDDGILGTADFEDLVQKGIGDWVRGPVVLNSCFTANSDSDFLPGLVRATNLGGPVNIAEMFSRVFPKVDVWGPTGAPAPAHYLTDRHGQVTGADFGSIKAQVYKNGKAVEPNGD